MSSYTRKLVIAAVLSCAGIGSSWAWYAMTGSVRETSGSKILARLESEKNDVQKRPVKRVIWQHIDEGEELHSGEAVRTSSDAEAKIMFNSGAEVDLDPDSVIVIEDSGDKVNLDFLKGNLLVKGTNQSSDLALKSGNTSISVKDTDLSLGKGTGSKVDVQVLRGSAQVEAGNKTLTLDENHHGTIGDGGVDVAQKFFKNPMPSIDEKVYIRQGEAGRFSWEGVGADYQVQLETGSTRDNLKPVGAAVAGSKGVIVAPVKAGSFYWRLVAMNKKDPKDTHSSPPSKALVVYDVPPMLLAPTPDQAVVLNQKNQSVELHWANPSHLGKLQLEIARDSQFKKDILNTFVEDKGVYTFTDKGDGDYYWRVAGHRSTAQPSALAKVPADKTLVSQARKFTLKKQLELAAPEMKFPPVGARLSFESISSGSSSFTWQVVSGVNHYHVKVEALKDKPTVILDKEIVDFAELKMPLMNPGRYRWFVTSLDEDGKESKAPEPRDFIVEQIPTLPWASNQQQETYYYVTEMPSLKPDWKSGTPYRHFRVLVKTDKGFNKTAEADSVEAVALNLPADGLYQVTVEATDAKGQTLARTVSKDFLVSAKPLLPPPYYEDRLPASLSAQNNGSFSLNWKPVSGAKAYFLEIKDTAGKLVTKEQFSSAAGVVKNLLPGQYKISLATIDQYGRTGPVGEEKGLVVPDVSDAKPPALKKIQIK